ncbi:MAG: phosphatase PAP2 family protein [Silicimonas sp.]|nr:phosphatase PAP2 family protein [Silicimonas sp.]
MTIRLHHAAPVLAPAYIYALLLALLPASMVIDVFVAPSIYWAKVYKIPLMSSIYVGYLCFLAWKTGPFHDAPLWSRILRLIAELMLLYTLTSACLPLLDQMSKISAWPLADWWLAAADEAIGFDWVAYFSFVHDRPILFRVMDVAYHQTGQLAFLLVVTLLLLGQFRRISFHMETVVWTTLISILISAFAPAYAAAIHYGIDFSDFPDFGFAPGIYHIESLVQLREANPDYRVGEVSFKGLVTFPSIHTALGVLMAGAVWRHWLFWPFALYAVVMVPSTPVLGSHYVVDVIAGFALASAVMWLVSRRRVYSGLFAAANAAAVAIPAE